ncbi:MAG: sigma-70 family RNA polymerase sigma factor [Isosphaeraceae bacterium]
MARILSNSTSRLIETLFGDGSVTGLTDSELLDRFVSRRDPAAEHAFEALVHRHGPMVLAVCRNSLGDLHDAEDAFQATFLVLARRASSLREPASLGPWLHGVARRIAQKARARRSRLERLIRRAEVLARVRSESVMDRKPIDGQEEAELLHQEIGRLPEKYRTPVVLCDLEGLSREEAARQLGWPLGTLGVRLMRARERLRARLTRRGMAPTGLAIPPIAGVAKPLGDSLIARTARAALCFASNPAPSCGAIPSHITAIAVGVLKAMAIKKLTIGTITALACTLIAAGSLAFAFQARSKPSRAVQPASPSKKADAPEGSSKSILTNGGFERADPESHAPDAWKKGATIAGVRYLWDQTIAHQGRASMHLKKTAPNYFPVAQWSQEVKRQGTTPSLKVIAFVKAQKMTKAILDVQFLDRAGQWSHAWAVYIGAKKGGDPPVTHEWKKYEGIVAIPDGTAQVIIAAQIYGPGDVWFDDVAAEYTDAEPIDPTALNSPAGPSEAPDPALDDVVDVPSVERKAGDDPRKRYFLIGPMAGSSPPAEGYRLLVVLPGGDGSAGFNPFARRIAKYGLPPGYLVAQPIAVSWSPEQARDIVWPTTTDRRPPVAFTTEEFVEAVIADVSRTKKLDRRFVFALGWSSGGPPAYACALWPGTHLTGSFVAMSVFRPERYSSVVNAGGRGFYILHSPEDFIPIDMAKAAGDELRGAGAIVELRTYEGGHGWHGDVYGEIRRGISWLEANHLTPVGG